MTSKISANLNNMRWFRPNYLSSSTFESVLAMLTVNKNVPAMGGIGLLALGLSMLGLGAVRLRKK